MDINIELINHIEANILPLYNLNDEAHNIPHIEYVINRSLKIAKTIEYINLNMVYTIAAYHDVAYHIDKDKHNIISAKMLHSDIKLKQFFTKAQIKIMAEAVEDHRASLKHEPRSCYGKIVSLADRDTSIIVFLQRAYAYTVKYKPNLENDEIIEDSRLHIIEKFGENGYAKEKMFFKDIEYEAFIIAITELANNKEEFIKLFKELNEPKTQHMLIKKR